MTCPVHRDVTGQNTALALLTACTLAVGAQFALPRPACAANGPWGLTREPGVTVYREPDATSHPLARVVREGDRVELLQGEGSWYKVRVGSVDGWVPTDQVRVDFRTWQMPPAATNVDAGPASAPPEAVTQVAVPPPIPTPVTTAPTVVATALSPDNGAPPDPATESTDVPEAAASTPLPLDAATATAAPEGKAAAGDAAQSVAAPTPVKTPAEPSLRGRWRTGVVLGYGFLDREADATLGTATSTLGLDRHRYAGVRVGYGVNEWLELELGAVYDWYRWDVGNSLSADSSEFSAFTLSGGPLFYTPRRNYGWLGTGAFFAQGALSYRIPEADLDFPVRDYDPAFGVQLAGGYEWRALQVRLGYSFLRHSARDTHAGADLSDAADPLDLSELFLDVTWSWHSE